MRILLVGDSHLVGRFGNRLEAHFTGQGDDVVRLAVGGNAARDFLVGRSKQAFADVTEGQAYDLAIIALGTNDAANLDAVPLAKVAANIGALAKKIDAPRVFWSGAPAFSAQAAVSNRLWASGYDLNERAEDVWQATSPLFGEYAIDPREITAPHVSRTDVHFWNVGADKWADFVFDFVQAKLEQLAIDAEAGAELEPPPAYQLVTFEEPSTVPWAGLAVVAGLGLAWFYIYQRSKRGK